jgi:Helix-turn-helix domain
MAERVRVREISNDEGGRLLKTVRRSSGSIVTWRRAQIVLWSAQGMDVAQIAPLAFTSEDRVRAVIHNFNTDGFDSLYPRYAGGGRRRSRRRRDARSRRSRWPDRRITGCRSPRGR